MDSALFKAQLIRHEDVKLKPYRCPSGKLTIGVGRNLEDLGISRTEAEMMLENDVNRVVSELDRALPWWRSMTDARQRVLADMAFNLGLSRLLAFENTLAAMRTGQYDTAANEMLHSLWARQVGERAETLARMMREG